MTQEEFEAIIERRISTTRQLLIVKGREYAIPGKDRLHNFIEGAKLQRNTPAETCWGYLTKHLVSIVDMLDTPRTREKVDEKIGDAIVYLHLLEAILLEDTKTDHG